MNRFASLLIWICMMALACATHYVIFGVEPDRSSFAAGGLGVILSIAVEER